MKKLFPVLLALCSLTFATAQKEAAIWYFGDHAGLDFNSGAPVPLTNGALRTEEGCATISNANGDLLFYTDGITVWNRDHQAMPNGTGLKGDPSSTQSAIIVPRPGSSTVFYVFTVDEIGGPDGLMYSELDMALNGSLGDITGLKNVLLASPVAEKLTAVQHANGTDIWVLAHGRYDNIYMAYLVTPAGVSTTSVNSAIGFDLSSAYLNNRALGYLKASPDGTKMAACFYLNAAELYDFDDNTGILSNARTASADTSRHFYGIEFSQDGRMLYVSNYEDEIYQYDTDAANLATSEVLLFQKPGALFGGLQLALDGKIYLANRDLPYLSVIEQPDTPGLGCNFVEIGVDLNGRNAILGLPPFIQSFFQVAFTAENFCAGSPTHFDLTTSETVASVSWDLGDGNTSTLETPSHTYAAPGDYVVEVTVTTATGSTTDTKTITIYGSPVANSVADFEVCTLAPNHAFDLSTKDSEVLGAQSAVEFQVVYFGTLTGAQTNTNPLTTLYTRALGTETIYARIQNRLNPDCYATTSFDLTVKQAPVLNPAADWTVCDTDTDGLYAFDLALKNSEIFNGQDTGVFNLNYFGSQADADASSNAIGPIYQNTASPQTIFYRIQNSTHPECYETGSFEIEVITGVMANAPQDLVVCDSDDDGVYAFDLSQTEVDIIGSQNPSSLQITYHGSMADAETGDHPLPPNYTNTDPYSETVYVRVANTSDADCYDTTSFELRVFASPTLNTVTDWSVCDPDNDATYAFDLAQKDPEIFGDQALGDLTITYHLSQADADADLNVISGAFENAQNPQRIFFRLERTSHPECYVTDSFMLEAIEMPTATMPPDILVCALDETGRNRFDLSLKDAEVLNGQDGNRYEVRYFRSQADALDNTNPLDKAQYVNSAADETLYVRVHATNLETCFATTQFRVQVRPLPEPGLDEIYVICPDSPQLTIDGGAFENWSWRDANNNGLGTDRLLEITTLGTYSLTVGNSTSGLACEKTVTFEVVSSGAPEDFTTAIEGFSDTVTILVDAAGTGDFEYSVDGENFQDSNRLEVFPGEHTVYVRDKFLCRTLSRTVIALGYQKFFTPNGDGIHDHWNIIGAENYPESQLFIYDRYGKLLKQISPTDLGWDGTFNGVRLPSSDYWFRYFYDNGKVFTGHFSLKR